jgi:hypothetical protein
MTYGKMSDEEKALIAVSKDKKIETALLSCAPCGITTVELTWLDFAVKSLEATERTAYNTLNRLTGSSGGSLRCSQNRRKRSQVNQAGPRKCIA